MCEVVDDPKIAVKIYHDPVPADLERRLLEMINRPPATLCDRIAWPRDLVEANGKVVGYSQTKFASRISLTELGSSTQPSWATPSELLRAAREAAQIIAELHADSYLYPDLHRDQFLIAEGKQLVLVDTASCQFSGFLCKAVLSDSQAPELLRLIDTETSWEDLAPERTAATDSWSLAILIFQLAMNSHPFDGLEVGVQRTREARMIAGDYPFGVSGDLFPHLAALTYSGLNPHIRTLFDRTFIDGHKEPDKRPTASEWADVLCQIKSLRSYQGSGVNRLSKSDSQSTQPFTVAAFLVAFAIVYWLLGGVAFSPDRSFLDLVSNIFR